MDYLWEFCSDVFICASKYPVQFIVWSVMLAVGVWTLWNMLPGNGFWEWFSGKGEQK